MEPIDLTTLSSDVRSGPLFERQRAMGPREDSAAVEQLTRNGMTIREIDGRALQQAAERLWSTEARALGVTSWLEAIRG